MATSGIEHPEAPGWRFTVKEVSNGWYQVVGRHSDGRSVGRDGDNPEHLLQQCAMEAQALAEKPGPWA